MQQVRALRFSDHMHMNLKGMYKFLCTTCFSIDRFDGPTFQAARSAASLQKYTPQDIRTYSSRRSFPGTSIHRVLQNYVAITGIPTLTLQFCCFLDFLRATSLVAADITNVFAMGEIFSVR